MVAKTTSKAQTFKLKTPLLSVGRTNLGLVTTDLLTIRLKAYAEGGENAMHCHTDEEHSFIVLAGEATFHLETDDNTVVVKPNEGIFLPKNAYYYFQSSGDTNLILLRVGVPGRRGGGQRGENRLNPDGAPLPGDSEANKHIEGVPIPGKFFGD